jgi:hypothetical protein
VLLSLSFSILLSAFFCFLCSSFCFLPSPSSLSERERLPSMRSGARGGDGGAVQIADSLETAEHGEEGGSRLRQQQEAAPHIRAAAPAGGVAAPPDGTAWRRRRSRRVASPQPEHPGCRVTSRALAADRDLGQRQCPSSRRSLWRPPRVPVRSRRRPGSRHPSLHLRKVSAATSTPLSMIYFLFPAIGST